MSDWLAYSEKAMDKYPKPDDYVKVLDETRKGLPAEGDRWILRYVVWALAIIAMLGPLFVFVAYFAKGEGKLPESLLSLSSAAIGALAAYLKPINRSTEPRQ